MRGVTLLELMVATSIFTIIMLSVTGIFVSVINSQRSAIASQNVQETMRYAMEMMGKEIRMAQENNNTCQGRDNAFTPDLAKTLYNTADSNTVLYFVNKDGYCVTYELEDGRLKITRRAGSQISDFLTAAKITITNLKFIVSDDFASSLQPKVTILADAKMAIGVTEEKVKIQTTISARFYKY